MKRVSALIFALLLCASQALADTTTQNPTGDEAESGTWSGATSTTRWTLVDDHPDSTCSSGDRILAGTAASEKTFTYTAFSIPAGATINSVQVLYRDGKTASQGTTVRARLKVGGSYFANGTTHNPANGGCDARTDTWTTNPATSAAWTVDQVNGTAGSNNLEAFGIGCTDCNPTVYFGSVQVLVDYTPQSICSAGSTWTDTGVKNINAVGGVDSGTVTLSSLSQGSLIVVATAVNGTGVNTSMTVSDGTNGSYSQSYYVNNGVDSHATGIHYFANNQASSVTITANPSGSTADITIAAHEFCTGSIPASPASGTPATNTGSGTTASSGSMTPADNDVVLVSTVTGLIGSGTLTENAGSEGFTLSNERESPTYLSLVYKIISGAPGSSSHSWTIPSAGWMAGIAAFKPVDGGGGATPRNLMLMGVGS